jgi:hypothetical protein
MNLMTKTEIVVATAAIEMMRIATVIGGGTIAVPMTTLAGSPGTVIEIEIVSVSVNAIGQGRSKLEGDEVFLVQ